ERRRVRGDRVLRDRDVEVVEAGVARGRLDAALGHAAADDDALDAVRLEQRVEPRVRERARAELAHDRLALRRRKRRKLLLAPAALERVAGVEVLGVAALEGEPRGRVAAAAGEGRLADPDDERSPPARGL